MDLRNEILNAVDRKREAVDVSEFWPAVGTVHVSVMEGSDLDSYQVGITAVINEGKNIRAFLLVRCLTDENGVRIFKDEDVSALSSKNWEALDKLYDVARRINKMSEVQRDDIEKNSAGASGASS